MRLRLRPQWLGLRYSERLCPRRTGRPKRDWFLHDIAPIYLFDPVDQSRRINFAPKLYSRLQKLAKHPTNGTPDEVAVFDYIYGVLHCPAYRATYAEFLKIDFPRIPWPASPDEFWDVSGKGIQLRKLHLMDAATIGPTQAFNTATSMGRLTLNVLLSFAQFEREVTAERIRDKIAASKKKGLWMGGTLPLGYDSHPDPQRRELVLNLVEAEAVMQLFTLYDKGPSRHPRRASAC